MTCKLITGAGYKGERLIEPSSSWFLPKFPSAVLALSMSDWRDLENQAEGYGRIAPACTPIRNRFLGFELEAGWPTGGPGQNLG